MITCIVVMADATAIIMLYLIVLVIEPLQSLLSTDKSGGARSGTCGASYGFEKLHPGVICSGAIRD